MYTPWTLHALGDEAQDINLVSQFWKIHRSLDADPLQSEFVFGRTPGTPSELRRCSALPSSKLYTQNGNDMPLSVMDNVRSFDASSQLV